MLQHFQKHLGNRLRSPRRAKNLLTRLGEGESPRNEEDGIWLAPIDCRHALSEETTSETASHVDGVLPMTLSEYLELVDATGRAIREDKAGAIPATLPPILTRLGLDAKGWSTFWSGTTKLVGTAVGNAASLAAEAARRKQRWIRSVWPVAGPG